MQTNNTVEKLKSWKTSYQIGNITAALSEWQARLGRSCNSKLHAQIGDMMNKLKVMQLPHKLPANSTYLWLNLCFGLERLLTFVSRFMVSFYWLQIADDRYGMIVKDELRKISVFKMKVDKLDKRKLSEGYELQKWHHLKNWIKTGLHGERLCCHLSTVNGHVK